MTAEKSDMFKRTTLKINHSAGPQIYLSLTRSGEEDCGSPKCSFVDSSSERDVKQKKGTKKTSDEYRSAFTKSIPFDQKIYINRYFLLALNGEFVCWHC